MNITLEERWNTFRSHAPADIPDSAVRIVRQSYYEGMLEMITFFLKEIPTLSDLDAKVMLAKVEEDAEQHFQQVLATHKAPPN